MKPIFTHIANDSRKAWSYNSDLSIWLSVDPMVDKYPNLSPYTYCAGNPVRLVDEDGNIVRDKNGNIVYSSTGEKKTFRHPSGTYATLEVGYVFANDGTPIQVLNNTAGENEGWTTNCHGTAFADGQYWLNNDQVPALLHGDGYQKLTIEEAQTGDILLYHGNSYKGDIEHSMTIVKTDRTLEGTEVYGQGGLEINNHIDRALQGWQNPKNNTIVRKNNPDRVVNEQEIMELRKSINNVVNE
ncbi:MAG: hypothetical protein J6W84_05950 [Bacteroidales bacterium]|nr:hypothetical protein [Bacteroidales bacterium]